MTTRTRAAIILVTAPVLVFALVGGLMGKSRAGGETYPHLRVFDDVFSLTTGNYVEDVDADRLMQGAMRGLAESLDADSTYLTAAEARALESGAVAGPAEVGLDLTRQYYLRVVAARDQSPAARAGLQPGDFIRAIDGSPTREMSVWEGMRRLRGAPGTPVSLVVIRGNAAEPHEVQLTRETPAALPLSARTVDGAVGCIRIPEIAAGTAAALGRECQRLRGAGVRAVVLDLRGTARGPYEAGIAMARVFVASGTLAIQEGRGVSRQVVTAGAGDGALAMPVVLLTDFGTAGAAEVFAAALTANKRAESLGERTAGRAARQRLFALPDGAGLWMSHAWYVTPGGAAIHERGLQPDVPVPQPDVEFGAAVPAGDATLDEAVKRLKARIAP